MSKENSNGKDERTLKLVMAGNTDRGCDRDNNEDCFYLEETEEAGWAVVADGLGGHLGGDVASELATIALTEFFLDSDERKHAPDVEKVMEEAFMSTHTTLHSHGHKHMKIFGMGTTLTAAYINKATRQLVVGYVGDSRYYRLRDGHLVQMTNDHNLAGRLLREDPDRHIPEYAYHSLDRAVGPNRECEADFLSHEIIPGDTLLLSTDGLNRALSDEQVAEILKQDLPGPDHYVDALIRDCLAEGAPDNVAIVVIMTR